MSVRRVLGRCGVARVGRGRIGLRLPHESERGIRSRSEREHGCLRTRSFQEQPHRHYAVYRECLDNVAFVYPRPMNPVSFERSNVDATYFVDETEMIVN